MGRKPSFTRDQLAQVQRLLVQGTGISEIAMLATLSRHTIYRIQADPAAQEAALLAWGACHRAAEWTAMAVKRILARA